MYIINGLKSTLKKEKLANKPTLGFLCQVENQCFTVISFGEGNKPDLVMKHKTAIIAVDETLKYLEGNFTYNQLSDFQLYVSIPKREEVQNAK